jgi:hypothetical protein
MKSPWSVEIKLGAEEPLKLEEAKRCELKIPMEIKRTARIRCGGRVPIGTMHLTSMSRRRGSLLPFVGRSASEA